MHATAQVLVGSVGLPNGNWKATTPLRNLHGCTRRDATPSAVADDMEEVGASPACGRGCCRFLARDFVIDLLLAVFHTNNLRY
jgi:hypothetical protein